MNSLAALDLHQIISANLSCAEFVPNPAKAFVVFPTKMTPKAAKARHSPQSTQLARKYGWRTVCNQDKYEPTIKQGNIMSAVFKISPDEEGFFQFEFVNSKGEIILLSPAFEQKEMAEKAIQDVRVGSLMSQNIAKAKTPDGGFFFMINDQSGTAVAKSILFDNEMLFNNALHSVREDACIADIAYVS